MMSQSDLLKNAVRWLAPMIATRSYREAVLSNGGYVTPKIMLRRQMKDPGTAVIVVSAAHN
jgi:hypothetical protein